MHTIDLPPRKISPDISGSLTAKSASFGVLPDDVVDEIFQFLVPQEEAGAGMVNRRLHNVVKQCREPAARQVLVRRLQLTGEAQPYTVRVQPLEVLSRIDKPFTRISQSLSFFHLSSCRYSSDGRYLMAVSAKPNYENRQYDAFIHELSGDVSALKGFKIPGCYHLMSSPDCNYFVALTPGAVKLFSRVTAREDLAKPVGADGLQLACQLPWTAQSQYPGSPDRHVIFSNDSCHIAIGAGHEVSVLSKDADTALWHQSFAASLPEPATIKHMAFDSGSGTLAVLSSNTIQLLSYQANKQIWDPIFSTPNSQGNTLRFNDDGESVLVVSADSVSLLSKTSVGWHANLRVDHLNGISKAQFTRDQNHCLIVSQDRCDLISRDGPMAPWMITLSRAAEAISDAQLLLPMPVGLNNTIDGAQTQTCHQVLITHQRELSTPFNVIKQNARLTLLNPTVRDSGAADWQAIEMCSLGDTPFGLDDGVSIYALSSDGSHIAMRNDSRLKLFSRSTPSGLWNTITEHATDGPTLDAFFLPGDKHFCIAQHIAAAGGPNNTTKLEILSLDGRSNHWAKTLSLEGVGLYARTLGDEGNLIVIGSMPGNTVQVYEAKASQPSDSITWTQGECFTASDLFDDVDRAWRFELSPDKNDLLVKGLKKRVTIVSR